MPHYDPSNAACLVFTYKEGLLSAMAHDLKLRVTRFDVEVDEARTKITARFALDSIRYEAVMRAGIADPNGLDVDARAKLENNIRGDVFPPGVREASFVATSVQPRAGGGARLRGVLRVGDSEQSIALESRLEGDCEVFEYRLHQPDFGIKPFRAPLGVLKVQAHVLVRFELPVHHA